jgi:hypothetical protein
VLQPGEAIGPAEVGILATVGAAQVLVHRRPHVAITSTGDEVGSRQRAVAARQPPQPPARLWLLAAAPAAGSAGGGCRRAAAARQPQPRPLPSGAPPALAAGGGAIHVPAGAGPDQGLQPRAPGGCRPAGGGAGGRRGELHTQELPRALRWRRGRPAAACQHTRRLVGRQPGGAGVGGRLTQRACLRPPQVTDLGILRDTLGSVEAGLQRAIDIGAPPRPHTRQLVLQQLSAAHSARPPALATASQGLHPVARAAPRRR